MWLNYNLRRCQFTPKTPTVMSGSHLRSWPSPSPPWDACNGARKDQAFSQDPQQPKSMCTTVAIGREIWAAPHAYAEENTRNPVSDMDKGGCLSTHHCRTSRLTLVLQTPKPPKLLKASTSHCPRKQKTSQSTIQEDARHTRCASRHVWTLHASASATTTSFNVNNNTIPNTKLFFLF